MSVNANGLTADMARVNTRQGRHKARKLASLTEKLAADVLCVQETHFVASSSFDDRLLPGFRPVATSAPVSSYRQGGVLIAVRSEVCAEHLTLEATPPLHACAARIYAETEGQQGAFCLICVYVPPASRGGGSSTTAPC